MYHGYASTQPRDDVGTHMLSRSRPEETRGRSEQRRQYHLQEDHHINYIHPEMGIATSTVGLTMPPNAGGVSHSAHGAGDSASGYNSSGVGVQGYNPRTSSAIVSSPPPSSNLQGGGDVTLFHSGSAPGSETYGGNWSEDVTHGYFRSSRSPMRAVNGVISPVTPQFLPTGPTAVAYPSAVPHVEYASMKHEAMPITLPSSHASGIKPQKYKCEPVDSRSVKIEGDDAVFLRNQAKVESEVVYKKQLASAGGSRIEEGGSPSLSNGLARTEFENMGRASMSVMTRVVHGLSSSVSSRERQRESRSMNVENLENGTMMIENGGNIGGSNHETFVASDHYAGVNFANETANDQACDDTSKGNTSQDNKSGAVCR